MESPILKHFLTHYLGLIGGYAALNSGLYYDRVPPVINSGYAQDSRGFATREPLRAVRDTPRLYPIMCASTIV